MMPTSISRTSYTQSPRQGRESPLPSPASCWVSAASPCQNGKRPAANECHRPRVSRRIGVSCHPGLFRAFPDRISWGGSMRLWPISVLLVAVLLVTPPSNKLNGQTTTSGGLTGVVTDSSHALVPEASVEIKDNAKGTVQSTKTDVNGVYRFFFLAPSSYTLTITHTGFRKVSRTVSVLLGPPGTVTVALEIATGSTAIKVTGEAPLLQAENGDVSTTMNEKQVSEVPNPGNDLTYITQTAPGAIMNTESQASGTSGGNVSILGMPGTSNLFTLNGMNNNNIQMNTNNSGVLGMMLGQNEVQEASIVSSGYSAQFGGAAGSNINFITKSGGNAFHGNAAYYWNGRVLNANDWLDNEVGNPRPFDIANQWAGSLGGPIVKDKLFFFLDTEGMHLVLPAPTYVVLPSAAFESATMTNIDSIFGPAQAAKRTMRVPVPQRTTSHYSAGLKWWNPDYVSNICML